MIKILTTGGTIDKVYFDDLSEYEVGPPQAPAILSEAGVTVPFAIETLFGKDSLELTAADREHIRERVAAAGETHIVITHGTDTMVDTALGLRGIEKKTIVLTGAMQPARFRSSDAAFHLGMAIAAVQCLPPGVYMAMQGRIFDPARTRKNRQSNRFEEG